MVKRTLSTLAVICATSLVALCLHQKNEQSYEMYSKARQYKNEIYYHTIALESNEVVHSSELSLPTKDEIIHTDFSNGEMTLAGITKMLAKADLKEDKTPTYLYDVTEKEVEMLQRITEVECKGKDVESKRNIVSTVLNRVESDSFPDDVESVIYQEDQFSPIKDGAYKKAEITEETKQAVEDVLLEGVTHDCLYFFSLKDVKSTKVKNWISRRLKFEFKDSAGHSYYIEK